MHGWGRGVWGLRAGGVGGWGSGGGGDGVSGWGDCEGGVGGWLVTSVSLSLSFSVFRSILGLGERRGAGGCWV